MLNTAQFELIVRVFEAGVWPITTIVIVFFLRKHISKLVAEIDSFKFGGAEIKLGEKVRAIADKARDSGLTTLYPSSVFSDEILENTSISPQWAIVETWINIERLLTKWAEGNPIFDNVSKRPHHLIRIARERGIIDEDLYNLVESVRRVRNSISHHHTQPLSAEDTILWLGVSKSVLG